MDCSVFNELRLQGEHCDEIIKVNGIDFNIHKIILCECSPYFRALFASRWNSTDKTLHGVTPDIMAMIIQYAYTRTADITTSNVEELFIAADQFNILGLVRLCGEFLLSQLCAGNAIGFHRFLQNFWYPELQHTVYIFILHHFEDIAKNSEEFLVLSVEELQHFIQNDELNVKQEEVVFEAILKWIDCNRAGRKQSIATLLSKVRLSLCHVEYIMNNVKTNNYVMESEECKPIIIHAIRAIYDLNLQSLSNTDFTNPLVRPRLPHSHLFATGGWSGGSPTNAIESYDCRADRWVTVTCNEDTPRAYHGTAYLKGYIYLIGGFDSIDYFNSMSRFDPIRKVWQQVAPMHCKRCYVSVTVLEGHIYAMGGFDGYTRLNSVECYDPDTNQWTLIAPMHEQRSDASATTLNGKVYICGGFNGNECLGTAEVYSPETKQWTLIAPMGSVRSGVGVIAYGDRVYAIGGFDGTSRLRSGECYNPTTNTWHMIEPMFNPRSNFGIEVVDDLLYAIGGFNGYSTTFNVESYDERTGEWNDAQEMSVHRSALSCCVASGLPNIRDYAAPRDRTTREEPRESLSSSALPG